jgi:hypothetical protein
MADLLPLRSSRLCYKKSPGSWTVGLGNPRCSTLGQPFLDAPFMNMIQRWKGEDPGPKPLQALASSAVHRIAKVYGTSPILRCHITSDLVVIAYFFLLQVGEYTLTIPRRGQHKCTVPLQKGDITFWHQSRVIPTDSPLECLLQADGATINLANQKNRVKDAKVSHTPSGDPTTCPCRSLARLVDALSGLPAALQPELPRLLAGRFWRQSAKGQGGTTFFWRGTTMPTSAPTASILEGPPGYAWKVSTRT